MEQEVKSSEPEITQKSDTTQEQKTSSDQTAAPQETTEQINWKKFREAREVERKQKVEAEKRANEKEAEAHALKAAMEALLNKQDNRQSNDGYQSEQDVSEDEKIQRKIDAALAERDKRYQQERIQQEQANFPQRLTETFRDFDQVCTHENLDYLEYHYPEVAAAFKNSPDGYDKWANVYKAVKRFVPNVDGKKEQNKADKNFSKPQAMSIAGKTQVGDTAPIQIDEAKRQANWQRMQRVMKGG